MIRLPILGVLAFASIATSFPQYGSLAGLSESELEVIIPTLQIRDVEPPPGPLEFNGTKLVNDKDHPWEPLRPGDIRGPCPGLNTLASHGVWSRIFFLSFLCLKSSFPNSIFRVMVSLLQFRLLMLCKRVGLYIYIYRSLPSLPVLIFIFIFFDLFRVQYGKRYRCFCYIRRVFS